MDEIPEDLWSFSVPSLCSLQNNDISSSTLKMKLTNTTSELDFQRFLQEFSIDHDTYVSKPPSSIDNNQKMVAQCNSSPTKIGINNKEISSSTPTIRDPKEYETYLKHRLDKTCDKIKASIPTNNTSPQESTSTPHESNRNLGSQSSTERPTEYDLLSNVQGNKDDSASGRHQVDSGSSMPLQVMAPLQSEEQCSDELEEELVMTKHPYYNDAKKMRRLLQNRESARRSRKKKQVQENEIEKQVAELKADQDSKTKLVIELSHRFSEEVVNNRLLQAKIEILKAKIKMAEDTLKRVDNSMEKQQNLHFSMVASNMDPSFVLVQHDPHRQSCVLPSSNTYDMQSNKGYMHLSRCHEAADHTSEHSMDCLENSHRHIYLDENFESNHERRDKK
ncbi:hypothetical protein LIER_20163 [Lithospermum erythrorhizon]|uniref:BZIP domain-containing protein n=1 Tax=Lithospermum erythrorhizon TaxID=34254 RepID=A0AAV3QN16_LITER